MSNPTPSSSVDQALLSQGLIRRFLEPEEHLRPDLREIFALVNSPTPLPSCSQIAVIETLPPESKIIGLLTFQLVAHAEPFWIDPLYRRKGLWRPLAQFVDEFLASSPVLSVYSTPTSDSTVHMVGQMGFEYYGRVYQKTYKKEKEEEKEKG